MFWRSYLGLNRHQRCRPVRSNRFRYLNAALALQSGQAQRIAIARALVHKPQLLLLDEPTSSLDRQTSLAIAANLKALARGITIVAASHQSAPIESADRVIALDNTPRLAHATSA